MSSLEKGMEAADIGGGNVGGLGVPMPMQEPRDKELPKEPTITGRSRSGTGKSSKEKKSMFGFVSGMSSAGVQ
jgi:p21-activated kinase 1